MKGFALSLILGFAGMFFFDMIVHGSILSSLYAQTPTLWRSPSDMQLYFPQAMMLQLILTAGLVSLYRASCSGHDCAATTRFMLAMGSIMGVMMSYAYVYMPISYALAAAWFVTGFAQVIFLTTLFWGVRRFVG